MDLSLLLPFLVHVALMAIGVGVLFRWGRRRVGIDSVCAVCEYNLTGLDRSGRCPECGMELATSDAVLIGYRRRRRLLVVAVAVAVLAVMGEAGLRVTRWSSSEYARLMPTSWLVERVTSQAVTPRRDPYWDELLARVARGRAGESNERHLMSLILSRQAGAANLATPWYWGQLLDALASRASITDEEIDQSLRNMLVVKLETRPAIRVGGYLTIREKVSFDPTLAQGLRNQLWMSVQAVDLRLGDIPIGDSGPPSTQFVTEHSHYKGGLGHREDLRSIPVGETRLRCEYSIAVVGLRRTRANPLIVPVVVEKPITIVPADHWVDTVERNPELQPEVVAAILTRTPEGDPAAYLKIKPGTVGICADVILIDANGRRPIGTVLITPNASPAKTLHKVALPSERAPLEFVPPAKVELVPNPRHGDRQYVRTSVFWGETIVVADEKVWNAYQPNVINDRELELRVVKAIKVRVRRLSGGKSVTLSFESSGTPVPLAFEPVVSCNGMSVSLRSPTIIKASEPGGMSFGSIEFPRAVGDHCTVALRPDPFYELSYPELSPPWGREIVFERVPIEP